MERIWKNTPKLQTADLSPPRIRYLDPNHLSEREKVDAPLMEISSTFIRNAYQTGKDIRFFLPEGVRPYFGSVANQWHTCDRRYTYLGYEVYILCHLKYIFFEKGSYTVIIYSFAILGQSAKIPIKTCLQHSR